MTKQLNWMDYKSETAKKHPGYVSPLCKYAQAVADAKAMPVDAAQCLVFTDRAASKAAYQAAKRQGYTLKMRTLVENGVEQYCLWRLA